MFLILNLYIQCLKKKIVLFLDLVPVKNLTVYKKSLKNRMVGLRWSYPENSKSDGFLISFNEDFSTTSKNITHILPKKCSAWPQSYCHTFYNVVPSNNYTVIVCRHFTNAIKKKM